MGKYFTVMIWTLTVPVIAIVALYQIGLLTGFRISLAQNEEPFFLISFLMYVPIGIVVFMLLAQQRIIRRQRAEAPLQAEDDLIRRLEKIALLKVQGTITESEFQKLKDDIISLTSTGKDSRDRLSSHVSGSEQGA